MKTKPQIFITGIYRSGTTLISRILNNHSQLWVTYDSVHFMRFSHNRFSPISNKENVKSLVQEVSKRIKRRWNMTFDEHKTLNRVFSAESISYGLIYDQIMSALMAKEKPEATGWGEKTNVCWGPIPKFIKMFPTGKVIHIIRDPRDVMCSFRKMTYEPGYRYLDAAFCSLSAFQAIDFHQKILGPNLFYLLRYETLLKNPLDEVKKICRFLDIEFEAPMLSAHLFSDKSGQPWSGDSSFDAALKTISTRPIGRWKTHAKPFEVYISDIVTGPYLKKHGYEEVNTAMNADENKKGLQHLLQDPILRSRYETWQQTGKGTEAYPSDPMVK